MNKFKKRRGKTMVHEVYAVIKEETIKNIAVYANYEKANQIARTVYGQEAFAIRCDEYPVSEGDVYRNGEFYFKDGVTTIQKCETEEMKKCEKTAADVYYIAAMAGIEI